MGEDFSYDHYSAVYNALSFGIAGMGSAMIFVWLQIPNVSKKYRTALIINGLVTGIGTYHYFRIFNSWNDAFDVKINSARHVLCRWCRSSAHVRVCGMSSFVCTSLHEKHDAVRSSFSEGRFSGSFPDPGTCGLSAMRRWVGCGC